MNKLYTITISLIVALGGFLLGFDSAVISGAVNGIRTYFTMSDWELGFAVGCVIFGAMGGNLVAGPLSDYFGRKKVLIATAILFTISATWSALATEYIPFVVARILGGIGIGAAILIAPIYIAEIAPPKLRGGLVSLNQLNIVIGISAAYFSNYFLKDIATESWRWMLGVEAIPAFIYFLALLFVPNSPRWLISKNQNIDKATAILSKIGGLAFANETISSIQTSLKQNIEKVSIRSFFTKKMTLILVIAFGLAFFQQITGINAIFYYAPTIFEQAGGTTDASLLQAIVVGLTNLIFTLVAIWLIDKLGRKPLLIIGTLAMTIALSMASYAFYKSSYQITSERIEKINDTTIQASIKTLDGKSFSSPKIFLAEVKPVLTNGMFDTFKNSYMKEFIDINATMVLIAILLYVAAFAISLGPVMWTMLSEIFPAKLKGVAISIVGFFNSLVSFAVTQVFPWELNNIGPTATFAIYAIMAFLALLFVVKFVVETKGKSLEELQKILLKSS